ncbi:putative F-box/LRR-repeat protein At3g18150 [Salvia hispanica]|uniref:putative F-box/LRR-repeat protein At3g18150 n=1 Tax=Salvia hispanica TaxID=49212 RepID=UPI002009D7EA|nr:putative F-box/LRR-repeat protein At3g18150 [Salvia hispanica]
MEEDRLSQFPDKILQHIISYLDFHECLQTTILSKRWKHLCRSLPDLRFNFTSAAFFDPFFFPYLLHRDHRAPVASLHLSFDDKFDLKAMKNSMIYAINHGVQSLRLHTPHRGLTTLRLPVKLLTPRLCGFPVNRLVLKAPKLRVLEIFDTCCVIQEISAPLLISFQYRGSSPLECSKIDLPMLEEVCLNIHGIINNLEWLHLKFVRLFSQHRNATTVTLTLDTLKRKKEDRISEQPDDILLHILSLIDTAEAVRASILSKRWKHLRPSLHNIRLNLHGAVSRHRVPRFVSQFLSHRNTAAPLHDFHL